MRVCVRNYHRYTHLILALVIVREPTVGGVMTSTSHCTYDICSATNSHVLPRNISGTRDKTNMLITASNGVSGSGLPPPECLWAM